MQFDWKHCLGEIRRLILLNKDIGTLRRLLNIENTSPFMLGVRKYAAPAN